MSNISSLIDVYRMSEIDPRTRGRVIVRLGDAINNTLGGNITEPLVYELLNLLGVININDDCVRDFLARYARLTA